MIKAITARQLDNINTTILADEEKKAKLRHETFMGMPKADYIEKLNDQLSDDCIIRKDPPIQFTKEDINAVASSRFLKGQGMTLVMGWLVALGLLSIFTNQYPIIPAYLYYVSNFLATLLFLVIYVKKQRAARKIIWDGIDGTDVK